LSQNEILANRSLLFSRILVYEKSPRLGIGGFCV
jgi:hypothetical protein